MRKLVKNIVCSSLLLVCFFQPVLALTPDSEAVLNQIFGFCEAEVNLNCQHPSLLLLMNNCLWNQVLSWSMNEEVKQDLSLFLGTDDAMFWMMRKIPGYIESRRNKLIPLSFSLRSRLEPANLVPAQRQPMIPAELNQGVASYVSVNPPVVGQEKQSNKSPLDYSMRRSAEIRAAQAEKDKRLALEKWLEKAKKQKR